MDGSPRMKRLFQGIENKAGMGCLVVACAPGLTAAIGRPVAQNGDETPGSVGGALGARRVDGVRPAAELAVDEGPAIRTGHQRLRAC